MLKKNSRELASTLATKQIDFLACPYYTPAASDDAAAGLDVMEMHFAALSLVAINALLSCAECKGCGGNGATEQR